LDPEETVQNSINLIAGDSKTVKYILARKTFQSALITVKSASGGTPISGASVRLHSTSLGFDVTLATDTYGQAYFPTAATPLASGTYDIDVSASGFASTTDTISIIGSNIEKKTISLNP
jgi:hypothetical protein